MFLVEGFWFFSKLLKVCGYLGSSFTGVSKSASALIAHFRMKICSLFYCQACIVHS